MSAEAAIPAMGATRSIEACMEVVSTMTTAIVPEDSGTIVEEMSVGIVAIDGERPCATVPEQRMEEIVGSSEDAVLPIKEDVTQISIAIDEVVAIDIIRRLHAEQIVEVDLVAIFVLLVVEIELIRHLIGEEQSLLASLLVIHCMQRNNCDETHEERGE